MFIAFITGHMILNLKISNNMNLKDQIKVINAGFTIIRCDDQPQIRIKYKNKTFATSDFRTYEKYSTKASRERALKILLNDPFIIIA